MAKRNAYPHAVALYAALLPGLRATAHEHGYALGVHGSMLTDLDLIAAPWRETASPADVLAEALREMVGGVIPPRSPMWCGRVECAPASCDHTDANPSTRAHGRLAYAIRLGPGDGGPYLDVSVMPRAGG